MNRTLQRRSSYRNCLLRVFFRIQILFSVTILTSAECGFYLAQSTIPGGGLGTFAGQRYRTGDIIGQPGIVIPVIDYRAHHPELEQYETFFESYCWGLQIFPHLNVEAVEESVAFVPGVGAALNYMIPLVNVDGPGNRIEMSNEQLHRSKDPGVGAFTPFFNRVMIAQKEIEPGFELFDSYGEDYFTQREYLYGQIPLSEDYSKADEFIVSLTSLQNNLCANSGLCSNAIEHYNFYHEAFELMTGKLSVIWPSRVLNALPKDHKLSYTMAQGGVGMMQYNSSSRKLDWLEKNGVCADNLLVRKSELDEQAGRGAFAKRFLPKGSIVAPAPLLHMRKSLLTMHPVYADEYGEFHINLTAQANRYQLILNYCFGHPQSSVSLCSYGFDTNLINHSKEKSNVKVTWNYNLSLHPEWLQQAPEKWIDTVHTGLVMDYIAKRDIQPGEEILLDYGDEWEAAWKQHLSTWKPPLDAKTYIPAVELNDRVADVISMTHETPRHNEDYVSLYCRPVYRKWYGALTAEEERELLTEFNETDLYPIKNYCRAIDRFEVNGEVMYTVEFFTIDRANNITAIGPAYDVLLVVPRDVFFYEDKEYSRE